MATTKKKGGLGKGLDSLIIDKNAGTKKSGNSSETSASEGWVNLDINKVEPNREQPRKQFDEDKLLELSESIKKHGIIEPIVVVKRDDYYQIIAGERRWRASKMAELKEVPVRIMDLTEEQIVQISLIENIQREDLNPIEEALAYKRLIDEFNYKQDEVAEIVSKSRTVITNSMRLLKLDEKVQQMVIDGTLSSGHARTILSLNDTDKQYALAERVMDEGLTVRDLEKEIKRLNDGEPEKKPKENIDPKLLAIYGELEEKLKQILGTKVSINPKDNNKGKIEIEYYSQDELDVITDKLMD
ncbi:MAG: ParB/RepB/Spo0J family partition protein [Lachnospiraceae bacterium]|nr:ParB/RepB/Spo0J family partition protein [Lachnospiraceae bacterium]